MTDGRHRDSTGALSLVWRGPGDPPLPDTDPESPRNRLRGWLAVQVTSVAQARSCLVRAIRDAGDHEDARLAIEELIDHLGRVIGCAVEREDRLGCSVWSSGPGARLAVWAGDAAATAVRVGQCTRAEDALLASARVRARSDLSSLCVVYGATRPAQLEDTVRVRRALEHVRLVTTDGLVTLARLVEAGALTHDRAVDVLRPASAFADPMIALAQRGPRRR